MSGVLQQRLQDAEAALDAAVQLLPLVGATARERQLVHAVWFACNALRSIALPGFFFRLGDKLGQQLGGNHVLGYPTWQEAVERFAQREVAGDGRVLTVPYALHQRSLLTTKKLLNALIAWREHHGIGLTVLEVDEHRLLVRVQLPHEEECRDFVLDLDTAAPPPPPDAAKQGQQHGTPEPFAEPCQGGEDSSGIHAHSVAHAVGSDTDSPSEVARRSGGWA